MPRWSSFKHLDVLNPANIDIIKKLKTAFLSHREYPDRTCQKDKSNSDMFNKLTVFQVPKCLS
jgi:hypothetical protein